MNNRPTLEHRNSAQGTQPQVAQQGASTLPPQNSTNTMLLALRNSLIQPPAPQISSRIPAPSRELDLSFSALNRQWTLPPSAVVAQGLPLANHSFVMQAQNNARSIFSSTPPDFTPMDIGTPANESQLILRSVR